MPNEIISSLPHHRLMQASEVFEIAKVFVELGVKKIRLTGGEPLVRKDARDIIRQLSTLPIQLTLTSNGVFVDQFIEDFRLSGIQTVNISLDTLDAQKFVAMTRRDLWQKTWSNILLLVKYDFRVKLNVVVMKGVNDNEILDFVNLTKDLPLHVRFIEFMPFDGNQWNKEKVMTTAEMLEILKGQVTFKKLEDKPHATAKKFQVKDAKGTFAFITTMSNPFCGDCNRMRLTADGKMKNCLFGKDEMDILGAFRAGDEIRELIARSLFLKHEKLGGQFGNTFQETDESKLVNRSMIKIGG
jgi:GTP 3',8-cyclase